jgi:hypothetical protein
MGKRNTGGNDRYARKKCQDGNDKLSNANPSEEYRNDLITTEELMGLR